MQPSAIARRILLGVQACRADRARVAVAGLAIASIAMTSCSSPQSSSAAGSGTGPTGGGVVTSDDPPWEDKIKEGRSREDMMSRSCWPKATVWAGPSGASSSAAPTGTGCPTIADLATLGYTHPSTPQDMTGSVVTDGPVEWNAQCCYLESHWHVGRPFVVAGHPRAAEAMRRADWARPSARTSVDGALAAAWLQDARLEHASIASFAAFALDLLALGAPSDLVARAHRAALDEIDHATRCFALATRYAGAPLGPGALPAATASRSRATLEAAVVAAIREGCVAETTAALLAEAQHAASDDEEARDALAKIAGDEADHATLAFAFVDWAVRRGGFSIRAIVEREIAELTTSETEVDVDDPRLSRAAIRRVSTASRELARASLATLLA